MARIDFGADAGRVIDNVDGKALEEVVRAYGLKVDGLVVTYGAGKATVAGKAATEGDREKALLAVGNVRGVSSVDDRMTATERDEEAQFHALEEGDTLSTLAARCYGVMRLQDHIVAANAPLLEGQELRPGFVLRVPVLPSPTHTVKKGETLGTIAKYWYGDARKHSAIHFVNRKVVEDPAHVLPGTELVIPARGPAIIGSEMVNEVSEE